MLEGLDQIWGWGIWVGLPNGVRSGSVLSSLDLTRSEPTLTGISRGKVGLQSHFVAEG
jgi:hypothetical protein